MKYSCFTELEKEIFKLYEEEKYKEALHLLNKSFEMLSNEDYNNNLFKILYCKTIMYSKVNMNHEVFDIISEMIDKGFSCSYGKLDNLPNEIKNSKAYDLIKEKNDMLRLQQQQESKIMYEVHLPKDYNEDKKYPVFFNLHGDGVGGTIADHKNDWSPKVLLENGFIVIYIQSSQLVAYNGYAWLKRAFDQKSPDNNLVYKLSENHYLLKELYDSAYDEIENCYKEIKGKYLIDEDSILIGGMSGGATACVDITMVNIIPIRGFIALCPELMPKSFTADSVTKAKERGVKGVFLEGENASILEDEERMVEVFKKVGFPYEFYINKGIGHDYPDDLDLKVENALGFILNRD